MQTIFIDFCIWLSHFIFILNWPKQGRSMRLIIIKTHLNHHNHSHPLNERGYFFISSEQESCFTYTARFYDFIAITNKWRFVIIYTLPYLHLRHQNQNNLQPASSWEPSLPGKYSHQTDEFQNQTFNKIITNHLVQVSIRWLYKRKRILIVKTFFYNHLDKIIQ